MGQRTQLAWAWAEGGRSLRSGWALSWASRERDPGQESPEVWGMLPLAPPEPLPVASSMGTSWIPARPQTSSLLLSQEGPGQVMASLGLCIQSQHPPSPSQQSGPCTPQSSAGPGAWVGLPVPRGAQCAQALLLGDLSPVGHVPGQAAASVSPRAPDRSAGRSREQRGQGGLLHVFFPFRASV